MNKDIQRIADTLFKCAIRKCYMCRYKDKEDCKELLIESMASKARDAAEVIKNEDQYST